MRTLMALAMVVALIGVCGVADAAKVFDDMSWWGNTEATEDPTPDNTRTGYWWYPTDPTAAEKEDSKLFGNRGVIYSAWDKPKEEPKAEPVPAPKPEPRAAPIVTDAEPRAMPEITVAPVKAERKAVLLNNVLFGFDKSTLTDQGKAEIDKLIANMQAHPQDTVIVEGHTCSVGESAYNMGLGQRRADSVGAHMTGSGIAANRVKTVSFGEDKPAVPNDTSASRKLNRRVEFKITLGE